MSFPERIVEINLPCSIIPMMMLLTGCVSRSISIIQCLMFPQIYIMLWYIKAKKYKPSLTAPSYLHTQLFDAFRGAAISGVLPSPQYILGSCILFLAIIDEHNRWRYKRHGVVQDYGCGCGYRPWADNGDNELRSTAN